MRLWARDRWALHAPADPGLLLREFLVEEGLLALLGLEDILLAGEIGVIIAGPAHQSARGPIRRFGWLACGETHGRG